mmetsp:Transcript_20561/g.45340  ORF Transcript_20561/g.45340 Transcript_20561/m.45340 type:complete len:338 (+) Transcript_20561:1778-2791(+)
MDAISGEIDPAIVSALGVHAGHNQRAGLGGPCLLIEKGQLGLSAADNAHSVVNVFSEGRVELQLQRSEHKGETDTVDVQLVGMSAENLRVARKHVRLLEHSGNIATLSRVHGANRDETAARVDGKNGQVTGQVVHVGTPHGSRHKSKSHRGLGEESSGEVNTLADKAVGKLQRGVIGVESTALDNNRRLVVVDALLGGSVLHRHVVLVKVLNHVGDNDTEIVVALDRAAAGVDAHHSKGPNGLGPLESRAQTELDLTVSSHGKLGHHLIRNRLHERRVEVQVHKLSPHKTTAVNVEGVGGGLVHLAVAGENRGGLDDIGENHGLGQELGVAGVGKLH